MTVIFGGAFDPPHLSHIKMAKIIAKLENVKKLLIIPSFLSPHKTASKTDFTDRLNMCKIAFGGIEKTEVCDIEKDFNGKSYTYNTLKKLIETGNTNLCLLIGADMAESFDSWYKAEEIVKMAKLFVFSRGNNLNTSALKKLKADFEIIDFNIEGMSSTSFRENKEDILSPKVLDYIKAHSLYGYDKIYKEVLKKNLKEKRYQHCLNVAESAVMLAKKYGADVKKAYTAGLLHDITKELPKNEQLKLVSNFGIIMSGLEKETEKLWHAITGSFYIREILKINDAEIFDAIRYHTTGKEGMSLFTKIIYIADYISCDRDYYGVKEMRKAANTDLDYAVYIATEFTVNDLKQRGKQIHPDTLLAYKECLKKRD